MRKYFLLSAVAMLVATSANATTDYAEVTAKATIEVANTFTCSDLNFGTIVVKQNNGDSKVIANSVVGVIFEGDILSVSSDASYSQCHGFGETMDPEGSFNTSVPDSVPLTDGTNELEVKPSLDSSSMDIIGGELEIPAHVKAGEYTGSFTVTFTY